LWLLKVVVVGLRVHVDVHDLWVHIHVDVHGHVLGSVVLLCWMVVGVVAEVAGREVPSVAVEMGGVWVQKIVVVRILGLGIGWMRGKFGRWIVVLD
jgi:hypothetical protein